MKIRTGTVLISNGNRHHGTSEFVVDYFGVEGRTTRIISKDETWIHDWELEMYYKIKDQEESCEE